MIDIRTGKDAPDMGPTIMKMVGAWIWDTEHEDNPSG
jgi:hypothetical protein